MEELDKILKRFIDTESKAVDSLHAAAFIVKDRTGKTIYNNAVGKLNFDADSPQFTADSICYIASLTKLVTAVSVLQLVERNVIGLDDDVGQVIPELLEKEILEGFDDAGNPIMRQKSKPITLRTLLTHTSGYAYDNFDPDLLRWSASVGRTVTSDAMSLAGWEFPLLFNPGDGWMYGIGLDWAGRVIEVLSSSSLESYMQKHIFKPLGMLSTTFLPSQRPADTGRSAAMASRTSPRGRLSLGSAPFPCNPPMNSGGAGLRSTANDYAKLLGALLSNDGRLLRSESIRELYTPQLVDTTHVQAFLDGPLHEICCPEYPRGSPVNYGLGGAINLEDLPGKRRKGSMMWTGVTNPRWWLDTSAGITAVLFTQVLPMGDAVVADLYDELEKALYTHIRGYNEDNA